MITVVVGKEIEKLKGEFESVINGMNMVGKIPYSVYSELFDIGTECIQKAYELGKAELEAQIEKMKRCEICKHYQDGSCNYHYYSQQVCKENGMKLFELKEIKEND